MSSRDVNLRLPLTALAIFLLGIRKRHVLVAALMMVIVIPLTGCDFSASPRGQEGQQEQQRVEQRRDQERRQGDEVDQQDQQVGKQRGNGKHEQTSRASIENGKIAFQSRRYNDRSLGLDIYSMDADPDSEQIILTKKIFPDNWLPVWSPSGKTVVFLTNRGSEPSAEVYVMEANGSNPINVSDGGAGRTYDVYVDDQSETPPAWSPDGKKIAFARCQTLDSINLQACINYDIYTVDAFGTNLTNLTKSADNNDENPAWSPDGTKIAFVSEQGSTSDIYTINAYGTSKQPTNLTKSPDTNDSMPTWSPDSTKIAFQTEDPNGDKGIHVMNADGTSKPTNLSKSKRNDVYPVWSGPLPDAPEGKIAFVSDRTGDKDIYTVKADGTNLTNLTKASGGAWDMEPAWSPDGKKIAFVSDRDRGDEYDIYTMDANGSDQTRLTSTGSENEYPSWQPVVGRHQ